jgi:hypothetical protein
MAILEDCRHHRVTCVLSVSLPFSLSCPRLSPSLSLSISLRFMMTTPHVIASTSNHTSQPATTSGVVGNHFRVGKKIGEGSFGVVFEGILLLLISFPSPT